MDKVLVKVYVPMLEKYMMYGFLHIRESTMLLIY